MSNMFFFFLGGGGIISERNGLDDRFIFLNCETIQFEANYFFPQNIYIYNINLLFLFKNKFWGGHPLVYTWLCLECPCGLRTGHP